MLNIDADNPNAITLFNYRSVETDELPQSTSFGKRTLRAFALWLLRRSL